MPEKILRVIEGSKSPVNVGAGKSHEFAVKQGFSGTIIAIYFNTTVRDVRLKAVIDGHLIEFPNNTRLNAMGLNQAAGYTHAGMMLRESYSTSPYGFAFEHPIEFDNEFSLNAVNEGSSIATLTYWIVLYEENL